MLNEHYERIPSGCAISGILNKKRKLFSGNDIIQSIALMHERSNGLGGGFAAYGIYPDYADCYAFHLFYDDHRAKEDTEHFLQQYFEVFASDKMPVRNIRNIKTPPLIFRYFIKPMAQQPDRKHEYHEYDEKEFVVHSVMKINSTIKGAYVFSSGKNMGAFKGVGYPEDIGEFYRLDEYKGYIWTSHGRFPTNSPGWWGGAHPFTLLDWSIVHNGEISSYDANKRYLEMFGYECTLQTDTEAITYIFDFLVRKQGMPLEIAAKVVAAPFWTEIDRQSEEERELLTALRSVYSSLLINGPFSIVLGMSDGIMALNDRIKLRPLTAAEHGDFLYVASEESAIREICPNPERLWAPKGGEPVIGYVEGAPSAGSIVEMDQYYSSAMNVR